MTNRVTKRPWLFTAVLLSPLAANAQTITYNFTGTVVYATGVYGAIAAGTPISGTYTFDFSYSNPSQTGGGGAPGNTTTQWTVGSYSGTEFTAPPVTGLAFSSTAQVGGFSYASAAPGLWYSDNYFSGAPESIVSGGPGPGYRFNASEQQDPTNPNFTTGSDLQIDSPSAPPWSSDGLPLLVPLSTNAADFYFTASGSAPEDNAVNYTISSLTPELLQVTPATLSFANQLVGTMSQTQSVTVTNNSTASVAVTSVTASGDFAAQNNCGTSVAPAASCTVGVTFGPTAVGTRTGGLTITADSVYEIGLSGTGTIAVKLTPSVSTVTVGVPVTLNWTSTTGAACVASGGANGDGWNGQVAASGTKSVTEAATGTYTYTQTCTLGSQSAQAQAVIADTVPTVSLSASPTTLTVGQPATLTWTSANAGTCTASSNGAGDGWTGTKSASGTTSITESTVGPITYTLTCTSGPKSAQATAQVFDAAQPSSSNTNPASGGGGGGGGMSLLSLLCLIGISGYCTARRYRREIG
jgi:hypothetical protein